MISYIVYRTLFLGPFLVFSMLSDILVADKGHGERKAEQLQKVQKELHREAQHDQPIVSHNLFEL